MHLFQAFPLLLLLPLTITHTHTQAQAQETPIPLSLSEYSIVQLGDPASSITVDFFLDLVCADTKVAWPIFKKVVAKYGNEVRYKLHQLPLPYHTNAFTVATGAKTVSILTGNDTSTLAYMDHAFAHQEEVLNEPTLDQTHAQVIAHVAEWVALAAPTLTHRQIEEGMADPDISGSVRYSFKYAGMRNVYGTPTYFVNEVQTPLSADSSVKDWSDYLDPLLKMAKKKKGGRMWEEENEEIVRTARLGRHGFH